MEQGGSEDVLDTLAVCNTAADPRIPPLKLVRLLSSYGGAMAAIAGGMVYQEEAQIGFWNTGRAAADLVELHESLGASPPANKEALKDALAEILNGWRVRGRRPAGFGVPARPSDERVAAIRRQLASIGRTQRPFWMLAEATEAALSRRRPLPMNTAGASGAACLDLGFQPRQIEFLAIALAQHALVSNALEGADSAPALLRRLPDSAVRYVGPKVSLSPRAAAAEKDRSEP